MSRRRTVLLHLCALLASCLVGPTAARAGSGPAMPAPPRPAVCPPQELGPVGPLVLRGGRWLDVEVGVLRANAGLVLGGGAILAVDGSRVPAGAREITLTDDQVVLPGLFDLHAHYAMDLLGLGRVDETEATPRLFLANGITTTFPAGEVQPERMLELRRAIDRGERAGPRILSSGPYFGRWRRGWDRDLSEAALRAEVAHWAAEGAAGFKAKGISPGHLRVLIDEAHRHGLTVTGHLDSGYRGSVNPRDAIAMGIDRIEHFLGGDQLSADRGAYASLPDVDVDAPEFEAIARLFVESGTYFDATLTAYGYHGARDPEVFTSWADEPSFFTDFVRARVARVGHEPNETFERIYAKKHETLRRFYELGGGPWITAGSDHPSGGEFLAAYGVHRELLAMTRAGLPPLAALRAATLNPARAMGLGDRLGSLVPGKLADLVVVTGDPLEDIRATRAVALVVSRGVPHDPATLLEGLRGTIGPSGPEDTDAWRPERRR